MALTPQQIQQYRTQYSIGTPPKTPASSNNLDDTLNSWKQAAASGADARASLVTPPTPTQPKQEGFLSKAKNLALKAAGGVEKYATNIGSQYMDSAKQIIQNDTDQATGKKSSLDTGLSTGAELIKSIFAPVTEAAKPLIKGAANAIAEGNNADGTGKPSLFNKAANSGAGDVVAKAQQAYQKLASAHPQAAKNFENAMTIAMGVAGGEGDVSSGDVSATIGKGADAITGTASKIADNLKTSPETLAKQAELKATTLKNNALKDITPDYETATPTQKAKMVASGKVQEGTLTKGRSLATSPFDEKVATEVSKIPGYDKAKTFLEKHNLTNQAFIDEAKNLENTVGSKTVLVPKRNMVKTVLDAMNKTADESLLLSKSDPAVTNFSRVIKNLADKVDGTTKGVLDFKKGISTAYKNARGSLAYNSDKVAPLDALNKSANTALKDFLSKNVKDADTNASFEKQFHLAQGADSLLPKVIKESGSGIGRIAQKHPIITKAVKTVGKTAGRAASIGAGVDLLH